jgi:hypothetical protein
MLLRQMTSSQFGDWLAFDELEPIGGQPAIGLLAELAGMYAEVHRDRDKRSEPYTALDFLPNRRETSSKPTPTPAELAASIKGLLGQAKG